MNARYAVVIEKAGDNCSAYVPDLPGCGETVVEVEWEVREAIRFHIDALKEDGLPRSAAERNDRVCRSLNPRERDLTPGRSLTRSVDPDARGGGCPS